MHGSDGLKVVISVGSSCVSPPRDRGTRDEPKDANLFTDTLSLPFLSPEPGFFWRSLAHLGSITSRTRVDGGNRAYGSLKRGTLWTRTDKNLFEFVVDSGVEAESLDFHDSCLVLPQ